jgi:uncharacterized RDD family membrane protein YckC
MSPPPAPKPVQATKEVPSKILRSAKRAPAITTPVLVGTPYRRMAAKMATRRRLKKSPSPRTAPSRYPLALYHEVIPLFPRKKLDDSERIHSSSARMSDDPNSAAKSSDSDTPKPNVPKPNIPKPDVPKPNIPTPPAKKASRDTPPPAPNTNPTPSAPPVSKFETGAHEKPADPGPSDEKTLAASTPLDVASTDSILHTRVFAAVIDAIIGITVSWILMAILPSAINRLGWLPYIAYMLIKDSLPFLEGQSIGKKAMSLRAVTTGGAPLTNNYKAGAIRNVFVAIPILALVELILLFTRENDPKRGLRLGDEFAHTKVITEGKREESSEPVSDENN